MRVSSSKIQLAIVRLNAARARAVVKLEFTEHVGLAASNYDSGTDTWDLTEKDAHKIEMLCGPYYEAVIKAWEARREYSATGNNGVG
jgi:hypothetical protein